MRLSLISLVIAFLGVLLFGISYVIPYRARLRNLVIPTRRIIRTALTLSPGLATFVICFAYTMSKAWSLWASLGLSIVAALVPYILNILLEAMNCYSPIFPCRIFPTPKRKIFFEIHIDQIMKTSETYPVLITLRPVVCELDYRGNTQTIARHVELYFDESPIAEKEYMGNTMGEIWAHSESEPNSSLLLDNSGNPLAAQGLQNIVKAQIVGPAFKIEPKEIAVQLNQKEAKIEFFVLPEKSGKHFLAVEFIDSKGKCGHIKTKVHIKDFILFRFIKLTETQVKVVRAIGFFAALAGVIVGILHKFGVL